MNSSPPLAEMPELLTVDELAGVLRVGRTTAYELVRSGAVPRVRGLGRLVRVPRAAVEKMLQGREESPGALRAVK